MSNPRPCPGCNQPLLGLFVASQVLGYDLDPVGTICQHCGWEWDTPEDEPGWSSANAAYLDEWQAAWAKIGPRLRWANRARVLHELIGGDLWEVALLLNSVERGNPVWVFYLERSVHTVMLEQIEIERTLGYGAGPLSAPFHRLSF